MHRSHFDTNKFKSYTKHILKFRIDDGDVQVKLNKKVQYQFYIYKKKKFDKACEQ